MSSEDKIKEYDQREDIHYYVYFSSYTYTYCVDTLQFKKKSDIKNEYYKNQKCYSKYKDAQRVADALNEKDNDVGHLFGRAAHAFNHKILDVMETEGISDAQKHAIEAAYENVRAITKLLNNEHF
jgi:hypothetical protein